jgi:hypothetical protein
MMLNIVCTSKPCDGLLYYSYEYCSYLNDLGSIKAQLVIVNNSLYSRNQYLQSICSKYVHCKNVVFDYFPSSDDVTLIMGRSMLTLSWLFLQYYSEEQKRCLRELFGRKLIAVYSENHPTEYYQALDYYRTAQVFDLCDYEVYPNGVGIHFEKTVNFLVHNPPVNNLKFKYLFLGTSKRYYSSVNKIISEFPNHGILIYDQNNDYIDPKNNHVQVPVENLMGIFDTYVYTKENFDPAPRLIQECKYFGKNMIYLRDKTIRDGGYVYWHRNLKPLDVEPILKAMETLI